MFLKTVQENEATGEVAQIYRREIGQRGFLMAATQCWTARPDLLPLYEDFSDGIRENFSLGMRGWRLITLIVAKSVPSTYCSHVYAKALVSELGSKEKVLAVQRDFRNAGLDAKEVAGLCRADRGGCIQGERSRSHGVAPGWFQRCADLRHRAVRVVPLFCQPVLRCNWGYAGGELS